MKDERPILLGMMRGDGEEGEALAPTGGSGYRLWKLSGLPLETYLAAFQRRNLLRGPAWSRQAAIRSAKEFLGRITPGQKVIVLGALPRQALEKAGNLGPNFFFVPHPSGRCRSYNERSKRAAVGKLLRRIADEERTRARGRQADRELGTERAVVVLGPRG